MYLLAAQKDGDRFMFELFPNVYVLIEELLNVLGGIFFNYYNLFSLCQVRVCMCSSSIGGTLLERHGHRPFVFYLGLCMIPCNITGTCSKSKGPNNEALTPL